MSKLRPTSRDAIIGAAFEVFSRDPSASLSQIAERAGVGRATLHRHFASRKELLEALALIAIEELDDAAEAASAKASNHSEALKLIVFAMIPLGARQSYLATELSIDNHEVLEGYQRQSQELLDLIKGCKDEGTLDQTLPSEWIKHAFEGLIYAAWEAVRVKDLTENQAGELVWHTLMNGFARRTP